MRPLPRLAVPALLLVEGCWLAFKLTQRTPLDLHVYLWGGHAVRDDALLYQAQAFGHWFTYPPLAALAFVPVATIPPPAAQLLWGLVSLGALVVASRAVLQLAGLPASSWAVAIAVAATLPLEPVRHTFLLGQVNIVLFALVLWDLRRVAVGLPAGVGIGIAAAIKLTPALFVVLLVLGGRRRAAATAAGTFLAGAALGFVLAPSASREYWSRLFGDTRRVGAAYISNQSPFGALARLLGGPAHLGRWYLLIAVAVALVGLAASTVFARRGEWLMAAAGTGVTSLLVSPISWTHHWVWVMPALLVLVRSPGRVEKVAAGAAYLLFALAPLWWTPHHGGPREYGAHGWVSLVANCYLIAGVAFLAWFVWRAWGRQVAPWGYSSTMPSPQGAQRHAVGCRDRRPDPRERAGAHLRARQPRASPDRAAAEGARR